MGIKGYLRVSEKQMRKFVDWWELIRVGCKVGGVHESC
jgi:hypothetical protein